VILEVDIFRAGKLLIDRRGADAYVTAAGRADLLLEEKRHGGRRRLRGYPPGPSRSCSESAAPARQ
jgi:hypothetical protein